MAIGTFLRVVDTVSSLATVARRIRRAPPAGVAGPAQGGQLEARLAAVVVGALKEAFDRDSTRLDLERARLDTDRRRAEEALRQQLARQVAEHETGRTRSLMMMAAVVWIGSLAVLVFSNRLFDPGAQVVLAIGWTLLLTATACALAGQNRMRGWLAEGPATPNPPLSGAATAAPWLVLAGAALTGASLILAL